MSWETISHIIFWVFFIFVVIAFVKGDAIKQFFIGTKDFFVKLWDMLVNHIEDRETYDKNKEEREKMEQYIKDMKSKKD